MYSDNMIDAVWRAGSWFGKKVIHQHPPPHLFFVTVVQYVFIHVIYVPVRDIT